MKCKQPYPEFELVSLGSFPKTITVTPYTSTNFILLLILNLRNKKKLLLQILLVYINKELLYG